MSYAIFLINTLIFVLFCTKLKLIGPRYISAPGIYYLASFMPTFVLIMPDVSIYYSGRPGYQDYSIAILLHTVMFGLGILVSYVAVNGGAIPSRVFTEVAAQDNDRRGANLFLVVYALFIVFFIDQLISLGSIPILGVLGDVANDEFAMTRELEYKLRSGPALYMWHFSRMVFAPFLAAAAFLMWRNRRSGRQALVFVLTLILTCANNALSSAAAPVAMIFAVIAICYVFHVGKIRAVPLTFFAIVALGFPFFIAYSFSTYSFSEALSHFSWETFNRFSVETFDRTLSYFDYFPYKQDYLWGQGTPIFAWISGVEPVIVPNLIFLERLDRFLPHLMHGNANAHLIGYLNADAGLWGVAVGSLVVGACTGVLDILGAKNARSIYGVALYATLAFIIWKYMGSHPFTVWFSHGAALCIALGYLTLRSRRTSSAAVMRYRTP